MSAFNLIVARTAGQVLAVVDRRYARVADVGQDALAQPQHDDLQGADAPRKFDIRRGGEPQASAIASHLISLTRVVAALAARLDRSQ
jgi:hypothetical protein